MKKLRFYMILFGVLVALPLAYVGWRTYGALARESQAQVRFFSEQLLDGIEAELADLVRREESRAVDEYRHTMVQAGGTTPSPLARLPDAAYILGYFQNNPDGSFQTPLADHLDALSTGLADRVRRLQAINAIFNQRKFGRQSPPAASARATRPVPIEKEAQSFFAERYLKTTESKKAKSVLGQKQARMEEITAGQAMNLAREEPERPLWPREKQTVADVETDEAVQPARSAPAASPRQMVALPSTANDDGRFQVEVAPLQTVAIDAGRVFIFRRIDINGRIYRQGFVLELEPFLNHLRATHYDSQPIAQYTRLTLNAAGRSLSGDHTGTVGGITQGDWVAVRTFPAPFGFLFAEMRAVSLPPSPARQTLTLALAILGMVMVAGLVTIYHSARVVMDLSERRAHFVSAVTHELKTPLTNIRMYIEMLDQGIAATPEREHEYLGILSAESTRLSNLINNVLELSRLEKQTRRFNLVHGDLTDVMADVQTVMAARLAREGFDLTIPTVMIPVFAYDREVLVQVLINLMENSIKFGRHLPEKRIVIAAEAMDGWVKLRVSDTGPGIPRRYLKQVFDDFFRVDNALTRTAGGTGIGLALVKKFILAMGGRVKAENNDGPGCTITLSLPVNRLPIKESDSL